MLTHFDAKVFRSHKLKGKAKAMVVTKDIECAIKYYQALNRIVVEKELPYKILIAFSGEKRLQHQEASIYPITDNLYGSIAAEESGTAWSDYTEAGMNGFPDSQTAEKFDSDDYRILVVANKYLTGFDQPKLCAMYVDKPLAGVLAVQALSRLNRSAPDLGKLSEDLFILDFYNTQDDIKEAFDPFYTSTTLSEATDVNILHELKNTLLSFGVFDMDEEVDAFIGLYIHGANADQWAPIIDAAADRFNFEIDWPENGKADFKMKCKQFVRIYSRVAAIMPFEMKDWEKLFWFLRYLIPGLHIAGPDIDSLKDLLDSVDLNTYGLRRTALNEAITLDAGETTIDPLKPTMVNAGVVEEDKDPLDEILKEFNNRWFNGWEATPDDQKMKLVSVAQAVAADEDYQTLVVGNPDQQAVDALMVTIIDRIMRKKRKGDNSLYKEYQQNEGFKADFRSVITRMLSDLDYLQA